MALIGTVFDSTGAVSVLDYGATPDDAGFDNTSAFQAALDNNEKVYVPNGVFYFSGTQQISMKSNNRLAYGTGTMQAMESATVRAVFGTSGDIHDLIVDGLTFVNFTVGTTWSNVNNFTIQNCTYTYTQSFSSADKVIGSASGIGMSENNTVNGVYFLNNYYLNSPRGSLEFGVRPTPAGGYETTSDIITDVLIKGCVFKFEDGMYHSSRFNTLWCSISFGGFSNGYVENCYAEGEGWGVELGLFGGNSVVKDSFFNNPQPVCSSGSQHDTNLLFENNHLISSKPDKYGFHHSWWGGGDRNVTFRNNVMGGNIEIQNCDNITFENNQITGSIGTTYRDGYIFLFDDVQNVTVSGNHLQGGRPEATQAIKAINSSTGEAINNTFSGNINATFVDNQSESTIADTNNTEQ